MKIDDIKLALKSEAYDSLREIILELTENQQISEAHLEYLKQLMLVDNKAVFDSAHNAFLFIHKDLLQSAASYLADLIPTSNMQARNAAGELLRGYGTNSFDALIPL